MNTLLFDFDDTLAEFSQAFYDKFGVRPEGTPKERYDEMAASLVRTDFIKPSPYSGWDRPPSMEFPTPNR